MSTNLNKFKSWLVMRSQTPAPEAEVPIEDTRATQSQAELAIELLFLSGAGGVVVGIGMWWL